MRGGPVSTPIQVGLALSVQPYTALRCLKLQPTLGITAASVAALSSLQQLTSLTTDLETPMAAQGPVDLAEYAHLTGAPPRLTPPVPMTCSAYCCAGPGVACLALLPLSRCCRAAGPARAIPQMFRLASKRQCAPLPQLGCPRAAHRYAFGRLGIVAAGGSHQAILCTACFSILNMPASRCGVCLRASACTLEHKTLTVQHCLRLGKLVPSWY